MACSRTLRGWASHAVTTAVLIGGLFAMHGLASPAATTMPRARRPSQGWVWFWPMARPNFRGTSHEDRRGNAEPGCGTNGVRHGPRELRRGPSLAAASVSVGIVTPTAPLAAIAAPVGHCTYGESRAFLHNVAALRATAVEGWADKLMIGYDKFLKRGHIRQATVSAVDDSGVKLDDGTTLDANYIVIATGSSYPYPGKPNETSTTDIVARYTRTRQALLTADSVVILGAGPVGIELAGEIATAHPRVTVTIIDSADDPLPGPYKPTLRERVRKNLTSIGVTLIVGDAPIDTPITDDAGVRTDRAPLVLRSGRAIPADIVLIAYGAQARIEALEPLRDAIDERGRIRVDAAMRVIGHPRLRAVGDVTDVAEPKQAVSAERHAKVAAATIRALAEGRVPDRTYQPATVHPIVLPQGPTRGAAQLPVAGGLVVGAGPTRVIKGKGLFVPRYRRLLKAREASTKRS